MIPSTCAGKSFQKNLTAGTPVQLAAKAPENGWLEYQFPLGMPYFQVLCLFQGGYMIWANYKFAKPLVPWQNVVNVR